VFPASVCKLDNGLTLIHQEIPTTPVVVADVWVRAGSAMEPEMYSGVAHFLEHMIFKGTATLPPGVFDRNIENMGGVSNAATSHDYTHYYLTTAASYLADTLPYLGELLINAAIPEAEFSRERDVVLEEIRACDDDPDSLGYQTLLKNIYQSHPYGRSVLGTEAELMQLSPETLRCFHRTHYQPENMTVVIVGGIAQQPTWELVNQTFANFAPRVAHLPSVTVREPSYRGIRRHELNLPQIEQARLLMAWKTPGVEELRTSYGLEMLSALLTEGRNSRLVADLREEKQLVQGVTSNFYLQRDSGLFTIAAWLEPEYLDRVESLIMSHLAQLPTTDVSESDLIRIRRLLCNEYAFSTETPDQLTMLYGYYHTIAQAELATKYCQEILSFESHELQKLASKYLCGQNYAVTILKPC